MNRNDAGGDAATRDRRGDGGIAAVTAIPPESMPHVESSARHNEEPPPQDDNNEEEEEKEEEEVIPSSTALCQAWVYILSRPDAAVGDAGGVYAERVRGALCDDWSRGTVGARGGADRGDSLTLSWSHARALLSALLTPASPPRPAAFLTAVVMWTRILLVPLLQRWRAVAARAGRRAEPATGPTLDEFVFAWSARLSRALLRVFTSRTAMRCGGESIAASPPRTRRVYHRTADEADDGNAGKATGDGDGAAMNEWGWISRTMFLFGAVAVSAGSFAALCTGATVLMQLHMAQLVRRGVAAADVEGQPPNRPAPTDTRKRCRHTPPNTASSPPAIAGRMDKAVQLDRLQRAAAYARRLVTCWAVFMRVYGRALYTTPPVHTVTAPYFTESQWVFCVCAVLQLQSVIAASAAASAPARRSDAPARAEVWAVLHVFAQCCRRALDEYARRQLLGGAAVEQTMRVHGGHVVWPARQDSGSEGSPPHGPWRCNHEAGLAEEEEEEEDVVFGKRAAGVGAGHDAMARRGGGGGAAQPTRSSAAPQTPIGGGGGGGDVGAWALCPAMWSVAYDSLHSARELCRMFEEARAAESTRAATTAAIDSTAATATATQMTRATTTAAIDSTAATAPEMTRATMTLAIDSTAATAPQMTKTLTAAINSAAATATTLTAATASRRVHEDATRSGRVPLLVYPDPICADVGPTRSATAHKRCRSDEAEAEAAGRRLSAAAAAALSHYWSPWIRARALLTAPTCAQESVDVAALMTMAPIYRNDENVRMGVATANRVQCGGRHAVPMSHVDSDGRAGHAALRASRGSGDNNSGGGNEAEGVERKEKEEEEEEEERGGVAPELDHVFDTLRRRQAQLAMSHEEEEEEEEEGGGGTGRLVCALHRALRGLHRRRDAAACESGHRSRTPCGSSGSVSSVSASMPCAVWPGGYVGSGGALARYLRRVFYTLYHPSCFALLRWERRRELTLALRRWSRLVSQRHENCLLHHLRGAAESAVAVGWSRATRHRPDDGTGGHWGATPCGDGDGDGDGDGHCGEPLTTTTITTPTPTPTRTAGQGHRVKRGADDACGDEPRRASEDARGIGDTDKDDEDEEWISDEEEYHARRRSAVAAATAVLHKVSWTVAAATTTRHDDDVYDEDEYDEYAAADVAMRWQRRCRTAAVLLGDGRLMMFLVHAATTLLEWQPRWGRGGGGAAATDCVVVGGGADDGAEVLWRSVLPLLCRLSAAAPHAAHAAEAEPEGDAMWRAWCHRLWSDRRRQRNNDSCHDHFRDLDGRRCGNERHAGRRLGDKNDDNNTDDETTSCGRVGSAAVHQPCAEESARTESIAPRAGGGNVSLCRSLSTRRRIAERREWDGQLRCCLYAALYSGWFSLRWRVASIAMAVRRYAAVRSVMSQRYTSESGRRLGVRSLAWLARCRVGAAPRRRDGGGGGGQSAAPVRLSQVPRGHRSTTTMHPRDGTAANGIDGGDPEDNDDRTDADDDWEDGAGGGGGGGGGGGDRASEALVHEEAANLHQLIGAHLRQTDALWSVSAPVHAAAAAHTAASRAGWGAKPSEDGYTTAAAALQHGHRRRTDALLRAHTPLQLPLLPCLGHLVCIAVYRVMARSFWRLRQSWQSSRARGGGAEAALYWGRPHPPPFATAEDVHTFATLLTFVHRSVFAFQPAVPALLRLWVGYLHHLFVHVVPGSGGFVCAMMHRSAATRLAPDLPHNGGTLEEEEEENENENEDDCTHATSDGCVSVSHCLRECEWKEEGKEEPAMDADGEDEDGSMPFVSFSGQRAMLRTQASLRGVLARMWYDDEGADGDEEEEEEEEETKEEDAPPCGVETAPHEPSTHHDTLHHRRRAPEKAEDHRTRFTQKEESNNDAHGPFHPRRRRHHHHHLLHLHGLPASSRSRFGQTTHNTATSSHTCDTKDHTHQPVWTSRAQRRPYGTRHRHHTRAPSSVAEAESWLTQLSAEALQRRLGWRALETAAVTAPSAATELRLTLGVALADLALLACSDVTALADCPLACWAAPHGAGGATMRLAQATMPCAVVEEVLFYLGVPVNSLGHIDCRTRRGRGGGAPRSGAAPGRSGNEETSTHGTEDADTSTNDCTLSSNTRDGNRDTNGDTWRGGGGQRIRVDWPSRRRSRAGRTPRCACAQTVIEAAAACVSRSFLGLHGLVALCRRLDSLLVYDQTARERPGGGGRNEQEDEVQQEAGDYRCSRLWRMLRILWALADSAARQQ